MFGVMELSITLGPSGILTARQVSIKLQRCLPCPPNRQKRGDSNLGVEIPACDIAKPETSDGYDAEL